MRLNDLLQRAAASAVRCLLPRVQSEAGLLAGVFFLSEMLWLALGVRFQHLTPLYHYVQYVDPPLLRDRFAETLFYLHVQPPLLHAFLGLVLQLPESWQPAAYGLSYSAMALGLVLASRALLAAFELGQRFRVGASVFLMLSPPLVLVAKWLYVPMPVATLLVVAALMLQRSLCQGKASYFLGYGACVSAIALITAYFHLVWVLAALLLLTWAAGGHRSGDGVTGDGPTQPSRKLPPLALAWLPSLLVVAVYVKNGLVFGFFTASTWSNVAPSRSARDSVGPQVMEQLIDQRAISPQMREDILRLNVDQLPPPETGVAVLDQKRRSSSQPNWNCAALLPVYAELGRDAFRIARHYPAAWLRHASWSFRRYQGPGTWNDYAFKKNRERLWAWCSVFEQAIWGAGVGWLLARLTGHFGWVTWPTLLVPMLFLDAARVFRRPIGPGAAGRADRALVGFLVANLLYVSLLAMGIADDEHTRYHLFSDALLFLLACRTAARWLGRSASVNQHQPRLTTALEASACESLPPTAVEKGRKADGVTKQAGPEGRGKPGA